MCHPIFVRKWIIISDVAQMVCKDQLIEKTNFIFHSAGNLKVFYTDKNKEIRVLCGSISLLLGPDRIYSHP